MTEPDNEQLRILKEQGPEPWNKWREEHENIKIALAGANLCLDPIPVGRVAN